jgi:hypothetical protein
MTIPTKMLVKLARQSAATWNAMAGEAFRGEARFETANTIYRFIDGVFASSAQKPSRSFEYPDALRGLRLIGFFAYENGFWSLSPRWRPGSLAVFWRGKASLDDRSVIVTSATVAFSLEAPPARPAKRPASVSRILRRAESSPPTLRRPAPPSMTRLHPADGGIGDLR